jgi:uroporphyrinogen decarboxylase
MTHRERVRKALNHEKTDRIPIDLGGCADTTITRVGYEKLKQFIGQPVEDCDSAIFWEDTVYPDEKLQNYLDVDVRALYILPPTYEVFKNPDGSEWYKDEYGVVRKKPADGYYFDLIEVPLTGELTIKKIENFNWPEPDAVQLKRDIEKAAQRAKYLYEETDYAILGSCHIAPVSFTMLIRGLAEWSMDIIDNPKVVEALMDVYVDINLEISSEFYKAVGKYCDVAYCIADDLATQDRAWFSIDTYNKYIKPQHKKIIDTVKKYTDAKIMFHCCGAASFLFPDLIEIGVEVFTPVQVSARDMDSKKLKKEFGESLTFWGGIDTQRVLPFGTPEDVRREVFQRIGDFTDGGGGYVLNSVHNILPEVPPENVIAMIEAAKEWMYE